MNTLSILLMSDTSEDTVGVIGVLLPIIISLGLFLMLFGNEYLRRKERMALIERGLEPNIERLMPRDPKFATLRTSLLLIGVGIGLLLSFFITEQLDVDAPAIYFPLLFIFGGLGLLTSYLLERKKDRTRP